MKRDPDLIRRILLEVERQSTANDLSLPEMHVEIEGHPSDQVRFHLSLLRKSGLILFASGEITADIFEPDPLRLTWAGCELLDMIRSDETWEIAKDRLITAGGFSFHLAQRVVTDYLYEAATRPPENPA